MLCHSEVVRRTHQNIILPTPDIIHISVPSAHLMTTRSELHTGLISVSFCNERHCISPAFTESSQ